MNEDHREQDWIAEAMLLKSTGLNADDARQARVSRYKKGRDWHRRERGAVYWRKTAAQALYAVLGLPDPIPAAESAAEPEPAQNSAITGPIQLQVWKGPNEGIANRIMVEAYQAGHIPKNRGDVLRVIVGDNRQLRQHQLFWARHKQADLWERVPEPRMSEPVAEPGKECADGLA